MRLIFFPEGENKYQSKRQNYINYQPNIPFKNLVPVIVVFFFEPAYVAFFKKNSHDEIER